MPKHIIDLTGKVVLITGGSRGMGREMALGFAAAGADVAITSRKVEACEALAQEIGKYAPYERFRGRPLDFVYFGGGTPSYIS